MSYGWKVFFLCTSIIILFGLLVLISETVEDKDGQVYTDTVLQPRHPDTRYHYSGHQSKLNKRSMSFEGLLSHPRVLEYCHLPDKPIIGMEGFGPTGYELKQVHIILSSGHKVFSDTNKDFPVSQQNTDCLFSGEKYSNSKIRSFENVSNHFSHSMKLGRFRRFSLFPNQKQCKHQQLSPLGVTQHINLGEFLQKIYINRWNLEKSKTRPKRLHVKSLLYESTFHSTVAFLHGFLSEKHFSKSQIFEADDNFCEVESRVPCKCPKQSKAQKYLQNMVMKGKIPSNLEKKLEDALKEFHQFRGELSALEFLQVLSPFICSQEKLICLNSKCLNLNVSTISHLFKTVDLFIQNLSQTSYFVDFVNFFIHPFINLLSHRLSRASNIFEQMFVYSADESFILYLLTAIRYQVRKAIRPASRIIFELYKNSAPEVKPYYLRVLFNGEDITNQIPLCSTHLRDGLCKLKYFIDYHHIESKHRFSNVSYSKMCKIS